MLRTQIYLTRDEKESLSDLSSTTGKKQSQLIREAVDQYIVESDKINKLDVIERAAGLWADRDDLPDFDKIRRSWDREHNDG